MTAPDDFHIRHIPFEACFNFRDVGGYRAADGRTVRWGRYFRSAAIDQMTEADARRARGLGIRTVLDLRRLSEHGPVLGPLINGPVQRHVLDMLPPSDEALNEALEADIGRGRFSERIERHASRYLQYLEVGADAFAGAFELLAREDSYPVVVHCRAGKDRTGLLTALLLDLLGVPEETIEADYVLTNSDAERYWRWMQAQGRTPSDWTRPETLLALENVMVRFFALFRARHGTARDFARSAGVAEDAIERIRTLLLTHA